MAPKKTVLKLTKQIEKVMALFPWFFKLYRLYYRRIVEQEIHLGCISCRDRVLCIGGGPFPCTALEIAGKTGARVHVIDNDLEAVTSARRVVESLNIDNIVRVDHAEGERLDVENFTVVHVALQVTPREEVLQNILQQASQRVRVLLREPVEKYKSYYAPLSREYYARSSSSITQGNGTIKATMLFHGGLTNKHANLKKPVQDGWPNGSPPAGRGTALAG